MSNDGVLELCWINARGVERCEPVDQAPRWVQDLYYQQFPHHNGVDGGVPIEDPWQLTEPVDKPWYQDIWDTVNGWLENDIVAGIVLMLTIIAAVALVWWLLDRAKWVDYADDAWDVEDYIEELNADAHERMYGNWSPQDSESYA